MTLSSFITVRLGFANMSHIDIYCDGSVVGVVPTNEPKKKPMFIGYAFSVVEAIGRTVIAAGRQQIQTTSQAALAELLAFENAVTYALFASNQHQSIHIHTDCLTIVHTLNMIMQRIAYKTKYPFTEVSNPDVWKRIIKKWELFECRVAVMHIKAHMIGPMLHKHHHEIDKVANRAARNQKIEPVYTSLRPTMISC